MIGSGAASLDSTDLIQRERLSQPVTNGEAPLIMEARAAIPHILITRAALTIGDRSCRFANPFAFSSFV